MKYKITEICRTNLIGILGEVPAKLSGEMLTILKNPSSFPAFIETIEEDNKEDETIEK